MTSNKTVPLVFVMDVEPDERVVKRVSKDWPGFKAAADFLIEQRPHLEDATGHAVRYNWLLRMDPQIEGAFGSSDWGVEAHRDIIDKLADAGDCFGLHIHTWRPAKRFFRKTWLADYEDVEWIRHCIQLSHQSFSKYFGYSPRAYSMGDNFMRTEIMDLMEELGARIDVTMASGLNFDSKLVRQEMTAGTLPDYTNTPRLPFKPSRQDITIPGADAYDVWEAPVSSGTIGKNRDGTDKRTKLLMGIHPDRITAILDQSLDQESPFLIAESRSDVRTHPKTRERFDWVVGHYAKIAQEKNLEMLSFTDFADRLDEGEINTAS